ncbi:unnamed protein product [Gordionus sp. m RMFG-2023]
MPNIIPEEDNLYLCYGDQIDLSKSFYIIKFGPLDQNHNAHHILLYGCEEPGKNFENPNDVWSCGEMAKSANYSNYPKFRICKSKLIILYAWAHNATALELPSGTGFKIGQGTSIQFLVMQIHYLHKNPNKDNSGIQLTMTNQILPRQAGVLLLMTGGSILAKSIESMEVACKIEESVKLHPFAYRVHTHKLGKMVSGYVIKNGNGWIRLGEKSPQLEQMFYPVENNVTIEKNDIVAAKCIMNNTRSEEIFIGPTDQDEMCNFYLMYYYDVVTKDMKLKMFDGAKQAELRISEKQCYSPGPPYWYWKSSAVLIQASKNLQKMQFKQEYPYSNSYDGNSKDDTIDYIVDNSVLRDMDGRDERREDDYEDSFNNLFWL